MISVLASCAVDRVFEIRSGQIKDNKLVFVASPQTSSIKEKEQILVFSESG